MATADPQPRGSWNLDEAVAHRWWTSDLDTTFRNDWPVADRLNGQYTVLNDQVARPVPPGPYCVYERSIPIVVGHMSSATAVGRENQLQDITIQFRIHAKSKAATATDPAESGKSVCIRLAKKVAEVYDPDTQPWTIYDDSILQVWREPDFHVREGEDEWVWVMQYRVELDSEYLL